MAPAVTYLPLTLPQGASMPPLKAATEGILSPFTMAELKVAIDVATCRTVPGPDGIAYESFKKLDTSSLIGLLEAFN